MKKKDSQKDEELSGLKSTVREIKHGVRKEWSEKEDLLKEKISVLENDALKKDHEVNSSTQTVLTCIILLYMYMHKAQVHYMYIEKLHNGYFGSYMYMYM